MSPEVSPSVCIVGAGVAGASLACALGRHGISVLLIERSEKVPERIVGELLQPGGVRRLEQMGLTEALQGIDAHPIDGYALYRQGDSVSMQYAGDAPQGRGFHNHRFIEKLRGLALENESVRMVQGKATELVLEEDRVVGVRYEDAQGEQRCCRSALTVLSDGCYSKFRDELSTSRPEVKGHFVGVVLRGTDLPFAAHGHVVLAGDRPLLCYPISSDETRVLIDFPGATPPRRGRELKEHLQREIQPYLPELLQDRFAEAIECSRFKSMPNQWLPSRPLKIPGAVLIGDSLNMRHPVTGGGMTVALNDVQLLGSLLVDGIRDRDSIDRSVSTYYRKRPARNLTINILADALYGVFRDRDLQQACFDYLGRGGKYTSEPVSILSGLNTDKDLLLKHFFNVAISGTRRYMAQGQARRAYAMIKHAVGILEPLLSAEEHAGVTDRALKLAKVVLP